MISKPRIPGWFPSLVRPAWFATQMKSSRCRAFVVVREVKYTSENPSKSNHIFISRGSGTFERDVVYYLSTLSSSIGSQNIKGIIPYEYVRAKITRSFAALNTSKSYKHESICLYFLCSNPSPPKCNRNPVLERIQNPMRTFEHHPKIPLPWNAKHSVFGDLLYLSIRTMFYSQCQAKNKLFKIHQPSNSVRGCSKLTTRAIYFKALFIRQLSIVKKSDRIMKRTESWWIQTETNKRVRYC